MSVIHAAQVTFLLEDRNNGWVASNVQLTLVYEKYHYVGVRERVSLDSLVRHSSLLCLGLSRFCMYLEKEYLAHMMHMACYPQIALV